MTKIAISPNVSGTVTFTIAAPDSNTDRTFTLPDAGGEVLTDQSDIEAQVKTATNATGSAPIYASRAWVNFNGTGTVAIRASGNVSSITDNDVGNYTINFTTAMPDANYSFSGSAASSFGVSFPSFVSRTAGGTQTSSALQIVTPRLLGDASQTPYDSEFVQVAVFR